METLIILEKMHFPYPVFQGRKASVVLAVFMDTDG